MKLVFQFIEGYGKKLNIHILDMMLKESCLEFYAKLYKRYSQRIFQLGNLLEINYKNVNLVYHKGANFRL